MSALRYGNWQIEYSPPPIPTNSFDYAFWHVDFGGDGDSRCGHAESVIDAMAQINEIEWEAWRCSCTAAVPGECMAASHCAHRADALARHEAYENERAKFAVGAPL